MSGFIFNRTAPFKALRRFKVQEFEEDFHVLRIVETSKDSQIKVEAMQFENIGEEQCRFARFAKIRRGTIWVAKPRCDAATVNSTEGFHNVEALRL